jgi:hypothetical protein
MVTGKSSLIPCLHIQNKVDKVVPVHIMWSKNGIAVLYLNLGISWR